MGGPAGWSATVTGRPAMRSSGRPPVRREIERAFLARVADGLSSEAAAVACGVSEPVGTRWFRERGGVPSIELGPGSGRYLSFAEREEIAILTAHHVGVREIARRLSGGRLAAAVAFALLTAVAVAVSAIVTLALVAAVWFALHAYELIWWREERARRRSETRDSVRVGL